MSARLLLVSNRLPVTLKTERQKVITTLSSGGLATGLRGFHELTETLWVGWPGTDSPCNIHQLEQVNRQLTDLRAIPVYLTAKEVSAYYEGFANGVLWPLFHYLVDKIELDSWNEWKAYCKVNQRFADTVAAQYRDHDLIWIHDYQLLLMPAMLRQQTAAARIGFFLHIPFPAMEVFRILPWRELLLHGMLGADLIGFHCESYRKNFAESIHKILGLAVIDNMVTFNGRRIELGVFPMGIDAEKFSDLAQSQEVMEEVKRIKVEYRDSKLILAVDRLDYTKGIIRRFLAIERLLRQTPANKLNFRFLQLAVPSRTSVDSYTRFRQQINETVGRINGTFGHINIVPIHYLFRSVSPIQLTALYSAADIMLVTPLRDGMNLVAKEYVASRVNQDGSLILSEFAGAADRLTSALTVNPYDLDNVAETIKRALSMPIAEQQERMRQLQDEVRRTNVFHWGTAFVSHLLEGHKDMTPAEHPLTSSTPTIVRLKQTLLQANQLILILDYDGTLAPFAATPDQATPDDELLKLLHLLALRPQTQVHIVSGRHYRDLDRWLGHLPVGLHAEHGYWSRLPAATEWQTNHRGSLDWKHDTRELMEKFSSEVPGSLIDEKHSSLAWHYRQVLPSAFGRQKAHEITKILNDRITGLDVELLPGKQVIELRPKGIHKGLVVQQLRMMSDPALWVAMGDDLTDEDLFLALPPGGIAIHVGPTPSVARYRLSDSLAVREFLHGLLS